MLGSGGSDAVAASGTCQVTCVSACWCSGLSMLGSRGSATSSVAWGSGKTLHPLAVIIARLLSHALTGLFMRGAAGF